MYSSKQNFSSPDWGHTQPGTNRVVNDNTTPRWMQHAGDHSAGEKKIARNDLVSLTALIVYMANKSGISEFRLERNLADRFDIPNIGCLPAHRYDSAIRFIVDGTI